MKKVLLVFLILMTFIMGCGRISNSDPNNFFNPKDMQVGDEVAGLSITELEVGDDGPNYSVFALFEGKTIIQGRFVQYKDHEFLGNAISFEVDPSSSNKLPKLKYDDRDLWFVFRNREEAIQLLAGYHNEGLTIEIVDYKIHYAPTEVVNEASIVRVIEGTKKTDTP
jgi:hypothetical protein